MNTKTNVSGIRTVTINCLDVLKMHIGITRRALDATEATAVAAIASGGIGFADIGQFEAAYGNLMPVYRNALVQQVRLNTAISEQATADEAARPNPLRDGINAARLESLENAVNLVLALHRDGKIALDPKAHEQLTLTTL